MAGAYLLLPLGPLLGLTSAWALLPLLTLPLAIGLIRTVFAVEGRPLNRALAGTGRLHMLFGVGSWLSLALRAPFGLLDRFDRPRAQNFETLQMCQSL